MFIGHFGVAFAAKKLAPRTSFGLLVFATEFLDLIWPIFLLAGIEHVRIVPGIMAASPLDFTDYPTSHSLVTVIGWSVLIGGAYFLISRYRRGAWIIALVVFSHWVLDAIVHRPDLPIIPGGQVRIGLGLWNSVVGSIIVELAFFAIGLFVYTEVTRATDSVGRYGLWSFVVLLLVAWVSTLFAGPPPSVKALAAGALIVWITVPWAWWFDHHRLPRPWL
jgi:hypothetical protein